ncbi:hypothetical protein K469DRAFT_748757 [Zopfia rhizophila CBS 207.26]|uniref:Uncharacterized protein n=1 Tax=Zopfia rhizophila CBS 207.26 TaxID=1314779 RepID=A0A6A6EA60_9PEZI|nr:hypothetical protein K469DRAFT_748757 [Zopfia rhizophila CBS 207.26]
MLLRSETSTSRKRPFAESDQNNLALSSSSRYPKRLKVDQNATTPTATRPRRQTCTDSEEPEEAHQGATKVWHRSLIPNLQLMEEFVLDSSDMSADERIRDLLVSVQQPKPLPPKRPYATFLEDSIGSPSNLALGKYCLDSVDSFVTAWVVDTSQSYRERHCRSDSVLGSPNSDLSSRLQADIFGLMQLIRLLCPTPNIHSVPRTRTRQKRI